MKHILAYSDILTWIRRRGGRIVFLFGIMMYCGVHVGFVQIPTMINRSVPIEPDDAYSYILKSSQMRSCLWQNCPTMEDLYHQFSAPSSDWDITVERERQYARIMNLYHPLFSLLLSGLHLLGISWEAAYNSMIIGGTLFIIGAIAYWMYGMAGYGISGLALTLMAFTVFDGQGLHYIVPSNLSLGIAILTWGMLLQHEEKRLYWVLPVAILAMVTMHPIGKVYAGTTLIAYLFLRYPIRSKRMWSTIGVSGCLLMLSFILPELIHRPILTFHSALSFQGGTMQAYRANIEEAFVLGRRWARSYGVSLRTMAVFILAGVLSIASNQRRKLWVMGGMTGTLLLGSVLYIYPGYTAVMARRVWIPFIIFLTVLISLATCRLLGLTVQLYRLDAQRPRQQGDRGSFNWDVFARNLVILVLLVIGGKFGQHAFIGYQKFQSRIESMISRDNVAFDPQQPGLLKSEEHQCHTVLYMSEIPLYFFLSHDIYDCGAVYYRAVKGTAEENTWIKENQHIRHVVAWNPILTLPSAREGGIGLISGERLEMHSASLKPLDTVEFYLENRGSDVTLDLEVQREGFSELEQMLLQVPAKWSGWLSHSLPRTSAIRTIVLEAQDTWNTVLLKGIRIDPASSLYWPWDQDFILTYILPDPEQSSQTLDLSSDRFKPLDHWRMRAIADGGSTVLAEVIGTE